MKDPAKLSVPSACADWAVRLFGLVFLGLGLFKFQGILFPQATLREYLGFPNPIVFFLSNRTVLSFAALIELLVGIHSLRPGIAMSTRSGLLLWFAASTLAYKFALGFVHYKGPCGCLLGISRFLPFGANMQQTLASVVVLIALVVSLSVLIYARWLNLRREAAHSSI